jgi:hypothetical protein
LLRMAFSHFFPFCVRMDLPSFAAKGGHFLLLSSRGVIMELNYVFQPKGEDRMLNENSMTRDFFAALVCIFVRSSTSMISPSTKIYCSRKFTSLVRQCLLLYVLQQYARVVPFSTLVEASYLCMAVQVLRGFPLSGVGWNKQVLKLLEGGFVLGATIGDQNAACVASLD